MVRNKRPGRGNGMDRVWFDDLALAFWILVVENGRSVRVPMNKDDMGRPVCNSDCIIPFVILKAKAAI